MGSAKVKLLKKGAIITIFLLTIVLVIPACSSPADTAPEEFFKVSFAANGGEPEPEAQLVPKGGFASEPEAMTRSGNKFDAWYAEEGFENAFDFATSAITGDITLYAKWNPVRGGGGGGGSTPVSGTPPSGSKSISISVTNPAVTLTPIEASSPAYSERSATFAITIPELSGSDTVSVGLASNSYGLTLTGGGSVGTGGATLTLTYNGTATVAQLTPVSVGLTVSTAGFTLTGSPVVSIAIIDGQVATGAIPLEQGNILAFNKYANTTAGLTRHYKLTENVTLSPVAVGESNWEAIGPSGLFTGSFDGQNHTISNLTINAPSSNCQGMFGWINGDGITSGIVQNLGLISATVLGDASIIGCVVGLNMGSVLNCYTTGSVQSNSSTVGGIAGWNGGLVKDCNSSCNVSGNDIYAWNVGGVVGENTGTVQNCFATGNVTNKSSQIGGVIGLNSGSVKYCYFIGSVVCNSLLDTTVSVGGVVGHNPGGIVEKCYANGDVSGNVNVTFLGGVVGDNFLNGRVENCYSTGFITGIGNSAAGGVAGTNADSTIQNCYTTSIISSHVSGGVAAANTGIIINCVVLNSTIHSSQPTEIGRLVSSNAATLTNNYARSSGMTLTTGLGPYTPLDTVNADNNKDGANVDAGTGPGQYNSQDFWENTMGWSFSGPNAVWEMGPGPNPLPKLVGVGP